MPIRPHVVFAVFLRNFSSYFSGINGFLFIVVFVLGGALFAFSPKFFTDNQCNLDELTAYYPVLLLFLIPAISMGAWAEEKRQGTEELLFTLPATNFEILLGKYKAVVAVYTVALLFSLTHGLLLAYLGKPDYGVLFSTYLGYWFAGICLIGPAMYASSLTSNITVAFVLGVVFCSIPIYAGNVVSGVFGVLDLLGSSLGIGKFIEYIMPRLNVIKSLSFSSQLQYFSNGLIYLSSIMYFMSISGFFMFLNYNKIGMRRWNSEENIGMGFQNVLRSISLCAILFCVNNWLWNVPVRLDLTDSKFYTLSKSTKDILRNLNDETHITIQVFVSEDVPLEYNETKKNLIGLMREFDVYGGSKVDVRVVNIKQYSKDASEAIVLGVSPRVIQAEKDGQFQQVETFLGAVVSSNYNDVIIPFFDHGVKIEYEISQAIGASANEKRKTIGILTTDAKVNGGFDMQTFRNLPEWKIITEIKKQYNVEEVNPNEPINKDKYDVLLAVIPSSLTDPQMKNFVDYVSLGKPALIFDDPLPIFNPLLSPSEEKPRQGGGMFGGGPPPEPKADGGKLTSLLAALDLKWKYDQLVFDTFNPETKFKQVLDPEFIFMTNTSKDKPSFNPTNPITSGLGKILLFYSGYVEQKNEKNSRFTFETLLQSATESTGVIYKDRLITITPFGLSMNPRPKRVNDDKSHIFAVHVKTKEPQDKRNVIFVTDSDILTDGSANLVEKELHGLKLDNVVFAMNALDVLCENHDFISLRKKRLRENSLSTIDSETLQFITKRDEEETKAREDSEKELEEAKQQFEKKIEKVERDDKLDEISKSRIIRNLQKTQQQSLDVKTNEINRLRDEKINLIKGESERKITQIKDRVRLIANIFSAYPAILLGVIVLLYRLAKERIGVQDERVV